jgi:hypothetical protein
VFSELSSYKAELNLFGFGYNTNHIRSVAAWKGEVRETLNRTMNKYMEQKHARDSRFR